MNLVLIEERCKVCKVKLTEYEFTYKEGICVDCHKEKNKVKVN